MLEACSDIPARELSLFACSASDGPAKGSARLFGNTTINRGQLAVDDVTINGSHCAWLLVTRRGLWATFFADHEWAFHRYSMPRARKLRKGDIAFVYLTKGPRSNPNCIAAVLRISSEGYIKPTRETAEFYPFRVPFETIASLEPAIEFPPLVPRMEFIKRKDHYGTSLQGKSAIPLGEADVKVIVEAAIPAAPKPLRKTLTQLSKEGPCRND